MRCPPGHLILGSLVPIQTKSPPCPVYSTYVRINSASAQCMCTTRCACSKCTAATSKLQPPASATSKPQTPSAATSKSQTPLSVKSKPQTPSSATSKPQTPSAATYKPQTPSAATSTPKPPVYWNKYLALHLCDKQQIIDGEWLTDKHINAAQRMLRLQFPAQAGQQDTLSLEFSDAYTSTPHKFV